MANEEGKDKTQLADEITRVIDELDSQKQKLRGLLKSLKSNEGSPEASDPSQPNTEVRGTLDKLINKEKEESGKRILGYEASLQELKKQLQELKEESKEEEEEKTTEVASIALDEPLIENRADKHQQQHRRIISENVRAKAHNSVLCKGEVRPQSLYVYAAERARPVIKVRKAVPGVDDKRKEKSKDKDKKQDVDGKEKSGKGKYDTRPDACDICIIV